MHTRQSQLFSVLVVEDDPEIAELLRNVLWDAYAVESVGDVPAALARLDRDPPGVILLDCLLPGGCVTDVLERAKTLRCSVVPMSGLPEILIGLEAAGYPCLRKPFRITELLEAIAVTRSRRVDVPPWALN